MTMVELDNLAIDKVGEVRDNRKEVALAEMEKANTRDSIEEAAEIFTRLNGDIQSELVEMVMNLREEGQGELADAIAREGHNQKFIPEYKFQELMR